MLKFNKDFIKNYDEDIDKGHILDVDVKYAKRLHDLHRDYHSYQKEWNVCNQYDKSNYVVHIRSLKQALDHGIILKKVHKVLQFNQEAWLKEYVDMNIELRKQGKNFGKDFFKLINNSVSGKTMENVRKHRDIKLLTTDKKRSKLVSQPNYPTTKYFFRKFFSN